MTFEELIKTKLKSAFNDYSDNYDHETEDNPVPYGDTFVNEGNYITDRSMERCTDDFKEEFDTSKASEFVADVLAQDDDFLNKVIELVKEMRF